MWLACGAVFGVALLVDGRERSDPLTLLTGAGFVVVAAVFAVLLALRRNGRR